MNWAHGIKYYTNLLSYAVIPKDLFTGSAVSLRVKAMRSKRSIVSSLNSDTRDKKLKGSVEESMSSDNEVGQGIPGDPQEIEAMTVKELRSALRSVGVPARGLKSDLVSALRCFLDQKPDGESSLEIKTDTETATADGDDVNLTSKDSHKNIGTVLEVFKFKGSMKSVKQSLGSDETVGVVAKASTRKHKSSVRNEDASGKEVSHVKRNVSSKIVNEVLDDNKIDISVNQTEPWTIFAHKKPQKDWIAYNPRTMRPTPRSSDINSVKLMSWNVNGLRALLKLEGFSALQLAQREDFDVLCLQETKLQEKDVEGIRDTLINGYDHSFWTCSVSKLGYSGTAIISRVKPLSVRYGLGISDHDSEGRLVTAEFDSFYLLCAYVPNSGDGLRRLSYRVTEWDQALGSYMKELEKSKPVILTGDLNCAHEEIDIYNPAGNKKSAGFTIEERQSFEKNFLSQGFVDTFRRQHPGVVGYTYWGYRHGGRKTNKGWRLDYFLVSESIASKVYDSYILSDVTGSDHCPIGLELEL